VIASEKMVQRVILGGGVVLMAEDFHGHPTRLAISVAGRDGPRPGAAQIAVHRVHTRTYAITYERTER
jgi:hypothetical protein